MPKATPQSLRLVFARNIRLMRIDAGMSQERLAAEAGLDRTFVGTLEQGQRNISIDNIELIAKAIDAPAGELLNPDLPRERGLDVILTRAPRTARPYPLKKRAPAVRDRLAHLFLSQIRLRKRTARPIPEMTAIGGKYLLGFDHKCGYCAFSG